ncbi:MAG: cell wall-associated NlpC family hydrolase [Patescibacteria group bacterium]|jgi:cell wall-associated NlpC family hydrolase
MNFKNITLRAYFLGLLILTVSACHSLKPVSSGSSRSSSKTTKSGSTSVSQLRQDITKYALRQKGAKYKYGAKGPKRFDCSGFTTYVYTANNLELPNGSYNQARVGKKVPLSKAKPGDLIFFGKRGKVNHVALVIRNSSAGVEVVHSTSGSGVIQENISKSAYWKPQILYARNVIGR